MVMITTSTITNGHFYKIIDFPLRYPGCEGIFIYIITDKGIFIIYFITTLRDEVLQWFMKFNKNITQGKIEKNWEKLK